MLRLPFHRNFYFCYIPVVLALSWYFVLGTTYDEQIIIMSISSALCLGTFILYFWAYHCSIYFTRSLMDAGILDVLSATFLVVLSTTVTILFYSKGIYHESIVSFR